MNTNNHTVHRLSLTLTALLAGTLTALVVGTAVAEVRQYDAHGRLTRIHYDSGLQITYAYDLNGNILSTNTQTVALAAGDVNADGAVDAVDVQLVINAALDVEVAYPTDQNGDQAVDAVDVQLVINAALGI